MNKPLNIPVSSESPEDYMRRLISYSFAIARMYGKADGGSVDPEPEGYAGGGALKKAIEAAKGIIAYHGSPHSFDRFDLSKIGTGEGAQAYGHGLYFADNEGVAKSYRDANQTFKTFLNGEPIEPSHPQFQPVMSIGANGYDKALKQAEEFAAAGFVKPEEVEAIRALKGAKVEQKPGGSMYQVRINADPAHFLDWDKPLSAQSPVVNQTMRRIGYSDTNTPEGPQAIGPAVKRTFNNPRYLSDTAQTPEDVTAAFREAGIPGIKYLDQGSRAAGEGSRNYVVFDDKLIDILKKYASGGDVSAPLTGQHTITLDDLIGRAAAPAGPTPGAYTDAGGQKIAAPFVTSMANGYPVAPVTPVADKDPMQRYHDIVDRYGYAGGGRAGALADIVSRALSVAKDVKPSQRIAVTHSLDPDVIPLLTERYNAVPAPSLALSKPLATPETFGSATLVGKPHLAVPAEDNPVFAADAYTPRFPKQFYQPSLEDVVNHIRSQPILGGEGKTSKGVGLLKAMAHPQFGAIEDIQKSRPNLTTWGEERDDIWRDMRQSASVLGGEFMQHAKEKTNYPTDQFIDAMADYIRGGAEGLRAHYPTLPQQRLLKVQNFISDLKALQPSYYEAKPLRGVGMDEFAGAVLPLDRQGRDAARALVGSGMPEQSIHFYNEDVPDSRITTIRDKFKDYGFADGGEVDHIDNAIRTAKEIVDPGQRAHDFVQDQLHGDDFRTSPLVDQYAGKTAAAALAANADRPFPTASEFAHHQLNKDEPQLPQFDRAARDTMRDYAIDALHGAAYFSPLAPAAGLYDAYKGLQSGDPLEIGLAATGVPGKLGKAGLMAAGALMPQEAQAGAPEASLARSIIKEIQSIGGGLSGPAKARAADPRLYHYGLNEGQKLSRPIGEMFATYKPVEGSGQPMRLTPEWFEGKNASLIPATGDRTRGGTLLESILGKYLDRPVNLQSGHEFQYGPAALGPDRSAWASAPHVVDVLAGRTRSEANAGFDPYLAYSAMHGTSADFSHHITDPILDMMRTGEAKVKKADVRDFDRMMRESGANGWVPYHDFPGILSPDVEDWLYAADKGKARTKIAQIMASADMAKRGFPDVPALRFATMDLGLLDAPPYGIGRSITKLDPAGRVIESPAIPHKTYSTQLGADPDVGYVGGFKYDIPPYISHKDWMDKAVTEKPSRADNPSALIKKFVMEAPATRMTPETIDRMSNYIKDVDSGRIIPPGVGDSRAFLWGSPYYQK